MMGTKANKHRGRNRYHGRGKKAGRGAGKRGGRGLAGINKHRVMTRIKYMPNHWGMHGFNRHPTLRTVYVTVNVSQLEDMANGSRYHRFDRTRNRQDSWQWTNQLCSQRYRSGSKCKELLKRLKPQVEAGSMSVNE